MPKDEKLSQVREIRKGLNEKLKAAVAAADEAYERAQTEWEDIPDEVYYNAYIAQKGAKGDKDRDGKTIALSASKNKKRAIDAAAKDLTTAQKRKDVYKRQSSCSASPVWRFLPCRPHQFPSARRPRCSSIPQ